MKAILLFFLLYVLNWSFLSACPCDWPDNSLPVKYSPKEILECDEIFWLTPTYTGKRKFMMLKVEKDDSLVLKKIFSDVQFASNVSGILTDSEGDLDKGYLIFKKDLWVVAVLRVESHITNKNAVRWCEWRFNDDGFIVILQRGGPWEKSLVTKEEFRSILKRIKRPSDLTKTKTYYVFLDWENSGNERFKE